MSEIIGKNIINLEIIDSTNNYAIKKLRENLTIDGTIIVAKEQHSGRGQVKNIWESAPNQNLTLSLILFPEFLPVKYQFLLSKIITLSICEMLDEFVESVSIKWPNDIYVKDKKIAGILIENAIMGSKIKHSIIGIGLNINQKKFKSDAPNPVSLYQITNMKFRVEEILEKLISHLNNWYNQLLNLKLKEIDIAFYNRMYRLNKWHFYKEENKKFKGKIIGVNPIGQLIIEKENGEKKTYHFKEVEFIL